MWSFTLFLLEQFLQQAIYSNISAFLKACLNEIVLKLVALYLPKWDAIWWSSRAPSLKIMLQSIMAPKIFPVLTVIILPSYYMGVTCFKMLPQMIASTRFNGRLCMGEPSLWFKAHYYMVDNYVPYSGKVSWTLNLVSWHYYWRVFNLAIFRHRTCQITKLKP